MSAEFGTLDPNSAPTNSSSEARQNNKKGKAKISRRIKVIIYFILFFAIFTYQVSKTQLKTFNSTRTFASDPKPYLAATKEEIARKVNKLKAIRTQFYIYDHLNITVCEIENKTLFRERERYKAVCRHERENDAQMLEAFQKHSLRTYDMSKADWFLPPLLLAYRLIRGCGSMRAAIDALLKERNFQKHHGNKHFIISTCFSLFKWQYQKVLGLNQYYHKISNMTAILSWDPNAVHNDIHHSGVGGGMDWAEFSEGFRKEGTLVRRTVSVGLGSKNKNHDLRIASVEKFYNSSNFVFYHTRQLPPFYNNSTIYRHVPVTNITQDAEFPKSSIGFDIKKEEWDQNFVDSKFCLILRGDSPHSHALWRSIRVGCIPVIISDTLPVYAPMFKSTLNMSDYAVMLKEKDLVNNPRKLLLELRNISVEDIEIKLQHLAFAQQVIFTDHPESLFIQAMLQEVEMATEVL